MNVVQINALPNGSTGKIANQLCELINRHDDYTAYFFCGNWVKFRSPKVGVFGTKLENLFSALLSQISGVQNIYSFFGTLQLISRLKKIKPDIIHLHNLHLWVINVPMLIRYIKKHDVKVVWTLHDCWSFTGHCPHFDMIGCDKWKTCCFDCPQYREYPKSLFDNSKKMYNLKKKWFVGVKNMTLVTPSEWLAGLARQSFLKDYPIKIINNGIDLDIFQPTDSDFRARHACENKYIVLGVAFGWGKQKGLDVFCELAEQLDRNRYQIVLVGTDEDTDRLLPGHVISIRRTQNQKELAEIYTTADVFANPTREENYPTVNMEAIACGTPVVTFNTGGSPEMLDETCGTVIPKDDVDAMRAEIIRICETRPYSKEACFKKAVEFDKNDKFKAYIRLYEELDERD